MIFLVSVVFVGFFYILPLRVWFLRAEPVFPALGRDGSWILVAFLAYTLMAMGALSLKRFEIVVWPGLAPLRERVTRRTGIAWIDAFAWRFALLASLLFLAVDPTLLPFGLAVTLAFASVARKPRTVRRVVGEDDPGPQRERLAAWSGEVAGRTVRLYHWQAPGPTGEVRDLRLELAFERRRYEECARANPANQGEFGRRVYGQLVQAGTVEEVSRLAQGLKEAGETEELEPVYQVESALAFVQAIPTAADALTKGRRYTRWPLETLYDHVGDADCKSILLAALLRELGCYVIIVERDGWTGVGVQVDGATGFSLQYEDSTYFICEPAVAGQRLGEVSSDHKDGRLWVYKIAPG